MKTSRIPVMCGCFICGVLAASFLPRLWAANDVADANDPKGKYKYLAPIYNQPYQPTVADWEALSVTAQSSGQTYLTDKLIRDVAIFFLLPDGMTAHVGTSCQPAWNNYLGEGKWAVSDRELRQAYQDAAEKILQTIRISFGKDSGLTNKEITINFFIRGEPLGTWTNGTLKLAGE